MSEMPFLVLLLTPNPRASVWSCINISVLDIPVVTLQTCSLQFSEAVFKIIAIMYAGMEARGKRFFLVSTPGL